AHYHLERCLRVWPDDPATLLRAARNARRRDADDEAGRHLAALERVKGYGPDVALERALLLAQRGDLEGLEEDLREKAHAGGPDRDVILEALAKGYRATFQMEDA